MGGYGGWRGQNSVNVGDRKGGGGLEAKFE